MKTPCGAISVMPAELAIVERALLAFYPQPDPEARAVAKKIGPPVVRRRESSADPKLRKAFDGERGPQFKGPTEK